MQRTRLEDVYFGVRSCPAAAVGDWRGDTPAVGTGLWEPPHAPGFAFTAAQVIHE